MTLGVSVMTPPWPRLAHHLRNSQAVFLALVVEHTRHSPGTAGAGLLVVRSPEDGDVLETSGTIGGGVMEQQVIARAAEILKRDRPFAEIVDLHHRKEPKEGQASGLICAGRQTHLHVLCRPSDQLAVVEAVLRAQEADVTADLVITPHGWQLERRGFDIEIAPCRLERLADGDFIVRQALLNRRRLAIFGGGHCALALARLCHSLGYWIVAFEQSKKPPEEGLREAVQHLEIVDDFRQAASRVQHPELTEAVVLTSDAAGDVRALGGILACPFPFIGVMGSAAKIKEIRRQLLDEGFYEDDLTRLTAPVGLSMLSNTPQEIAVSIAAQLLRRRAEPPT